MNKYVAMTTNRDKWIQIARESKGDKDATAIAVRHAREWNRQALILMRCHTRYGFPLEAKA